MSQELSWSSKRQAQEFDQAKEFLLSMGLHPSLQDATFEDVKKGNIAARRSLGDPPRTAELEDPSAGSKSERRQIPVERSGGGT
jgi:glycerol-3-phosphate dehydrogenase